MGLGTVLYTAMTRGDGSLPFPDVWRCELHMVTASTRGQGADPFWRALSGLGAPNEKCPTGNRSRKGPCYGVAKEFLFHPLVWGRSEDEEGAQWTDAPVKVQDAWPVFLEYGRNEAE